MRALHRLTTRQASAVPRCADAALDVVRGAVLRACETAARLQALAFGSVRDALESPQLAGNAVADCAAVPRAVVLCAARVAHGSEHVAAPLLALGVALLVAGSAVGGGANSVVRDDANLVCACVSLLCVMCARFELSAAGRQLAATVGRALLAVLFRVHGAVRGALLDTIAARLLVGDAVGAQCVRLLRRLAREAPLELAQHAAQLRDLVGSGRCVAMRAR